MPDEKKLDPKAIHTMDHLVTLFVQNANAYAAFIREAVKEGCTREEAFIGATTMLSTMVGAAFNRSRES